MANTDNAIKEFSVAFDQYKGLMEKIEKAGVTEQPRIISMGLRAMISRLDIVRELAKIRGKKLEGRADVAAFALACMELGVDMNGGDL